MAAAPSRIIGLDVARGLALIGMFAAHTVPEPAVGESVFDGRSSILFATVAGVSLGLLSGAVSGVGAPRRGSRSRVARVVAIRGLLLIALGMALTFLETPIAIILDTYGLLFIIAIPLLYAPRWVLAVVATASALLGPWVVDTISLAVATSTGATAAALGSPAAFFPLRWLDGTYPAPVWLAYITVGILIARSDVRSRATQLVLLTAGAAVAVVTYAGAAAAGHPVIAHDDTTWEVLASGGVAVALIGLLLAATESSPRPVGTVLRRVLQPVWAAGSMPLTIYTLQIVAIFVYTNTVDYEGGYLGWQSVPLFFAFVVPALLVASLYRLRFSQGPLEWLVARLSTQRPWRGRPAAAAQPLSPAPVQPPTQPQPPGPVTPTR